MAPAAQIIVVLGMHRSGTSLCANMLQAMGADMADAPGAGPANARGHWERPWVNDLNDRLFALYDRSWSEPAHVLDMPEHWLGDPRVQAMQRQAAQWLSARLGGAAPFGMKDPRLSRLMPFWHGVFAAIGAAPRYVLCVREPGQAARSVAARDGIRPESAEYRWLIYTAAAVRGVGEAPVCVVPYEDWFSRPDETAERLAAQAGLPAPPADLPPAIVAPELRHDSLAECRPLARRLHRLILRCAERGKLDADLRGFCAQIGGFERSVQPLLVEAEVLRATASAQARVIGDLNALVHRLRPEAA